MMELGGNINLKGFDTLNPGELAVFKKIVGNKVKDISNKVKTYESLTINLDDNKISALLQVNGKDLKANADVNNLFFALNDLFNDLEKKI